MLVTLLPLTVQTLGVVLLKLTARPDVAIAEAVVEAPSDNVVGKKLIAPMDCPALRGVTWFEPVEL